MLTKLKSLPGLLHKAGIYLRLVDEHDCKLSLTNIVLMCMVGKIMFQQDLGAVDLGTLLLGLLSYAHKKQVNKGANVPTPGLEQIQVLSTRLETLEDKVRLGGMGAKPNTRFGNGG